MKAFVDTAHERTNVHLNDKRSRLDGIAPEFKQEETRNVMYEVIQLVKADLWQVQMFNTHWKQLCEHSSYFKTLLDEQLG